MAAVCTTTENSQSRTVAVMGGRPIAAKVLACIPAGTGVTVGSNDSLLSYYCTRTVWVLY